MLICCGLCPLPSSTEVMEVIAQTTLDLKAAIDREMADFCTRSGKRKLNSSSTLYRIQDTRYKIQDAC